jgi:hypothetical protein
MQTMGDDAPYTVRGPQAAFDILDRLSECELALESAFLYLMDVAIEAGWSRTEVAISITNLADDFLLGDAANNRLKSDIKAAIGHIRRGKPNC